MGVAALVLTELLGPFHLRSRWPLTAAWLLAGVAWPRLGPRAAVKWRFRPVETSFAAIIVAIGGVVALTAILSPPNSADAMAYHLPRVIYWAQSGSVAFFPTPYLNQIMLQPLDEYLMLHTYVLTGGDRLINLIAFAAYAGSIVGVSAVAGAFGLNTRSQAWAALFCATLPNAILQASGAKNDFLLAFWLVCAVYFAARRDALWLGLSAALALATKGTAYLFLPPLLVYAAAVLPRRQLAWIAGAICVHHGPHRYPPVAPVTDCRRCLFRRGHPQSPMDVVRLCPAGRVPAVLPVPEMAALSGPPGAAVVHPGRAAGRIPGGEASLLGGGRGAGALPGEQRAPRALRKLAPPAQRPAQPLGDRARRRLFPRYGTVKQPRFVSE